jgi:heat shock protein HtpX
MTTAKNIDPRALRSHDFRNFVHTVLLVGGTAFLAGAIAFVTFGYGGIVYAVVFSAAGIFMLGRASPKMVLSLYKARPLAQHEVPELHAVLEQLSANAGLPAVPKLHYVPSKMMNAFAVGSKTDSAVAVTDGLLRARIWPQGAELCPHMALLEKQPE